MSKKHDYNINIFTNKDDLTYYILGAWITDGNISIWNKNYLARITSNDLEWIEKLRNIICDTLPISIDERTNRTNEHYRLTITNKNIVNWFIENKCLPNKSLKTEVPPIPEQYMLDFIRGCIDGDGWISLQNQGWRSRHKRLIVGLCSGSKKFIISIQNILKMFDIKSSITIDKAKKSIIMGRECFTNNVYKLIISGKSAKILCELCYYNGHKISMKRKLDSATELINYFNNNPFLNDETLKNCKILWPNKEEMIKLLKLHNNNCSSIARIFGVAPITVIRRLKKIKLYPLQ